MALAAGLPGGTLAQDEASGAQEYGGLPPGEARREVFGLCGACHSLMIVKQQRLSKAAWLDTLAWMSEEQGMPQLPPESLERIASYLAEHYGTDGD